MRRTSPTGIPMSSSVCSTSARRMRPAASPSICLRRPKAPTTRPAAVRSPRFADNTIRRRLMKRRASTVQEPGRRRMLKQTAALGAATLAATYVLRSAHAQANADIAAYTGAKLNWRQAEGESITVAVIPASYFENLIAIAPTFQALTGVNVRFEKVPPGQIRQKAMLDLSSKTGTYATSATAPMYYPLYVSNRWIEPIDRYLGDSALTDAKWFDNDDIFKAW